MSKLSTLQKCFDRFRGFLECLWSFTSGGNQWIIDYFIAVVIPNRSINRRPISAYDRSAVNGPTICRSYFVKLSSVNCRLRSVNSRQISTGNRQIHARTSVKWMYVCINTTKKCIVFYDICKHWLLLKCQHLMIYCSMVDRPISGQHGHNFQNVCITQNARENWSMCFLTIIRRFISQRNSKAFIHGKSQRFQKHLKS